jgi:NDP-sugar pyrophosphorylase family protein
LVHFSDETAQLLETGGGLKKAQGLFRDDQPILIHNVDILSNADLDTLYASPAAEASLLVSDRPSSRHLLFDDAFRLVGWQNVKTGELRGRQGCHALAFSGIHLFHPSLFPMMDQWPERFSIIDFYLNVCSDHLLLGIPSPHLRLMDVGKIDTLAEADAFASSVK